MKLKKYFNWYTEYPIVTYFYFLVIAWTLIIVGFLAWSHSSLYSETILLARQQAITSSQKDIMFRAWAAMHGGVYVPITEETPPNPYLADIPERDIATPSGKKLTLMNPAYMTRQIHELSFKSDKIRGHITSLNPIREKNKPDSWEKKALKAFEKGIKEYYGFDTKNDQKIYRYMVPLITEKTCLKCHTVQGYKLGQIRGGISASVPWKSYEASIDKHTTKSIFIFGLIWLIGFSLLLYVRIRMIKYINKRNEYEEELKVLNEELYHSRSLVEDNLFDRNQLVEEITEANIKLNKLNLEKDRFFSIIAHDLRSPFNGLIGLTELIANDAEDYSKSELSDLGLQINQASSRLYKLLQNLLDWSQMQNGMMSYTFARHNLLEIVLQNLALFEQNIEQKEISIKHEIDKAIFIHADENMFNSIIRNLISNAIKFTQPKGCIKLFAKENTKNEIEISISDSGIGIPEELKGKIFKIEEKVNREGTNDEKGTGLGLILCKEFVEIHGGKIWVESKEGEGSTFHFTLPPIKNKEKLFHESHNKLSNPSIRR